MRPRMLIVSSETLSERFVRLQLAEPRGREDLLRLDQKGSRSTASARSGMIGSGTTLADSSLQLPRSATASRYGRAGTAAGDVHRPLPRRRNASALGCPL